MTKYQQVVTVLGGTGFVGRYVVQALARAGYTVNVISRYPELALRLKTAGHVGQIVLQKGDITRPESYKSKLEGSFAVVNLVGVLKSTGRQNFQAIHANGVKSLAELADQAGIKRFVQVSALGADAGHPAHYARTKADGEEALRSAFPTATILRPSVIFGAEDNFYNQFACLSRIAPALPLIGGGHTKFQPVFVGDVADAVIASLALPSALGQTFELGGPRVYTFAEILTYINQQTNRKTRLISLPFWLAGLIAGLTGWLPAAPLTTDQVKLLKRDNIVEKGSKTFSQLGIKPVAVEAVIPDQLSRFRARSNTLNAQHAV